jgi:antitoxin MazE
MESVIRKWGNSPALRLNQSALDAAVFRLGQHVVLTASKGRIVIEAVPRQEYKLDELLAQITPANTHEEAGIASGGRAFNPKDLNNALKPLPLLDEVSKGLEDVTAGRVKDARAALTVLKNRRSAKRSH